LPKGTTLYKYALMSKEERQIIFTIVVGDDNSKFLEHEECISALPLVKLTMSAVTEGEDDVCVGDLITCKMRVDYVNLKKGE
jgi:hypothetical protein